MSSLRAIVVCYSRSGNTRRFAEHVADQLDCPLESLWDRVEREGLRGWIRSAFDGRRQRTRSLHPYLHDPAAYDVVILGAPVWAGHVATPIRSYLVQNSEKLKNVAFFCTHGSARSAQDVIREVESLCGKPLLASTDLRTGEVSHDARAEAQRLARRIFSHFGITPRERPAKEVAPRPAPAAAPESAAAP